MAACYAPICPDMDIFGNSVTAETHMIGALGLSQLNTMQGKNGVSSCFSKHSHCACQSNHLQSSSPFNYYVFILMWKWVQGAGKEIHVAVRILFRKIIHWEKNSHVLIVQFRKKKKKSSQTLARAKVPRVHKSWQQQKQQTRVVSTVWKDLEGWDKEQAVWMTAQCETSSVSIQPALHGCQRQKTLHHTASGSRTWWTPSLTLLPQETVPPGHGWGRLARVTEGGMQV